MGKEIEIRYELNNKNELEKRLNEKAKLIHTSHQIDTYYDNKLNSFAKDPEHIYDWLRVRESMGKLHLIINIGYQKEKLFVHTVRKMS